MIHSNLKLLLPTTTLWRKAYKILNRTQMQSLQILFIYLRKTKLYSLIFRNIYFFFFLEVGVYYFLSIYILYFILILKQHKTKCSETVTVCALSIFQATTPLHRLKTSSLETVSYQPIASHLHPPTRCLSWGSGTLEAPSENRSHV